MSYDYDATDALVAIRENGATSGTGVLARYGYDDLGRRVSRTLGNGLVTGYGYDPASRLTGLTTSGSGGNAVTLAGYNPAGQIGTRSASNDAYAWGGAVNVSRAYVSNGLNQYTQSGAVTPSYDARGNLTGAGGAGYSYNARNLLTGFGTGGIYYNPLSQLLDVSTERAWMVYDGAQTIAEMSYDGPLTRRYIWGPGADDLVLWYEGAGTSQRRWADLDERGSTTRISNDAGATLWISTYDEYGIPGAGNAGRFQYTGQAWIPALGMYNYKARIYSPTLGRFLQTDPIGYGDGMNWHDYVGGDPVNRRDPSGLESCPPGAKADLCASTDTIVVTGQRPNSGGGITINPVPIIKAVAHVAKQVFCGIFGGCKKKHTVVQPPAPPQTPQNGTPHRYALSVVTQCSADSAFAAVRAAGNSAPNAPYARSGTNDVVLLGGNPITQTVDLSARTITNVTGRDHMFYPGTVEIGVRDLGGGYSSINIRGGGTGADPTFNVVFGSGFFGGMAHSVADYCVAKSGTAATRN